MKKIIIGTTLLLSITSCKQALPKMYTTFDKGYNTIGSFYSTNALKIGSDTTIEGRKVTIIQAN